MKERESNDAETRDESVYDAYLKACATGRPETPEAVFLRHPDLGEEARSRIGSLWLAASLRTDASAPRELARLGAYRLVERLDSGGMGTVFRALRDPDGAEFAVKVLRPELAGSVAAVERLRREATAVTRVGHPNVVRIHGFHVDGVTSFLVLELVRGRGLDEILAETAARGVLLPVDRVVRWGIALARGLEAAHAQGVIHRDVKPSNVRVRPDDSPVLLDFGIATVPERTRGALTTTFAGSPFYAAPEQLSGATMDGRTDVYGLCVTLYQCLTGRVPFAGDRFENVMRRTLTEPPVPVRRLAPHVPVSLETVVLAGLEKDRSRRPASAAALAEDLETVLRGGRVKARRPGPVRLAGAWARRRPGAAAVAALCVLVVMGLAGGAWFIQRAEVERVREEARTALREAEARTDAYAADASRTEPHFHSVNNRYAQRQDSWLADDVLARLDAEEDELENAQRRHEAEFHAILGLLERAERLEPATEGLGACRARICVTRWREANVAGDYEAARLYRSMVERSDPVGPAAREVAAISRLSVVADPPDAEIHLFRVVQRSDLVRGGGRRLVGVPLRGSYEGLPPSPSALRVVKGAGSLREGAHIVKLGGRDVDVCALAGTAWPPVRLLDVIAEIDGVAVRDAADAVRVGAPGRERAFSFLRDGERIPCTATSLAELGVLPLSASDVARRGGVKATVWDDGTLTETMLAPGLDVRMTAAPLLAGPASRVSPAEAADMRLPMGEYSLLLRREGHLDVRAPVVLQSANPVRTLRVRLPLPEERHDGFAFVAAALEQGPRHLWLQDREVTAREYLEFLNDPATLSRIDATPRPLLVPRHEVDPPLWSRGPDGCFRLPEGTSEEHPLLGVSFEDAQEYARWLTRRSATKGEPWSFRLPSFDEWLVGSGVSPQRVYTFGPRFRARWASSCFSRPAPAPEPVLTYPVDESPYGLFDMCGSAMEWVDDWYDAPRGLRRLAGGSWAQGLEYALGSHAPRGARPDRADREFGIRLVVERTDASGAPR